MSGHDHGELKVCHSFPDRVSRARGRFRSGRRTCRSFGSTGRLNRPFLLGDQRLILALEYFAGIQLIHKEVILFCEQVCVEGHRLIHVEPLLGLWANAIVGKGILPLGQAQVGDEQTIIGCKGICEKMPV